MIKTTATPELAAQAAGLRETLTRGQDLIAALDAAPLEAVMELLPPGLASAVKRLAARIGAQGPGRLVLDSDGTAFLRLESGDAERDQACYLELQAQRRVFPGGGIKGELAQEYTYGYKVHPAQVAAWRRLAAHGVEVGVLSGRKEDQLAAIYDAAVRGVPGFVLLPSKGRVTLSEEGARLSPQLEARVAEDPLRDVAQQMVEIIVQRVRPERAAELEALEALDARAGGEFERRSGYRVSIQAAAGKVVMIRLHHRFRACELAAAAGCPAPNVEDPMQVDGRQLSEWLATPAGAPLKIAV